MGNQQRTVWAWRLGGLPRAAAGDPICWTLVADPRRILLAPWPLAPLKQVDARDYGVAAHILKDLGATSVALLTNNPAKHACLRAHGIEVTERLPLLPPPHAGGGNGAAPAAPAHGSLNGSQPHLV